MTSERASKTADWLHYLAGSFASCSLLCAVLYGRWRNVVVASEVTAQTHHLLAAVLGMLAMHASWKDVLTSASVMGANAQFPLVEELQYINIGYFLYDCMHVFTWDTKFILHHIVALLGFGISAGVGCFGLANAVNTVVAELGSIMYNQYNKNKTLVNYKRFVLGYGISRLFFAVWTFVVVYHCLSATQKPHFAPRWIPYFAAALQITLLVVNAVFLATHVRKLRAKLAEDKTD